MQVCKQLEPQIQSILEDMCNSLDLNAAGFAIVNVDNTIGYCALYNVMNHMGKLTVSKGIDVLGMVLATKKPVIIDDYCAFPKAISAWIQMGVKSALSLPVFIDDELIGAVTALSIDQEKHFSDQDIDNVQGYAEKIRVLLDRYKHEPGFRSGDPTLVESNTF